LGRGVYFEVIIVIFANANCTYWTVPGNIGSKKRERGSINSKHSGVAIIYADHGHDDLHAVAHGLIKERPQGAVNHARSKNRLIRRFAFAASVLGAQNFSGGIKFLNIVHG